MRVCSRGFSEAVVFRLRFIMLKEGGKQQALCSAAAVAAQFQLRRLSQTNGHLFRISSAFLHTLRFRNDRFRNHSLEKERYGPACLYSFIFCWLSILPDLTAGSFL